MSSVLRALASLRLTVVLLGMSIFLVLAGTLAQRFDGIWTVMDGYFRCPFAWIELRVFFPEAWGVGGGFPFPGGKLLGAALLVNLTLAHAIRFKVRATGARLLGGLLVTAAGAAATWFVIADVFEHDSTSGQIDPAMRVTLQLLRGGGAAAVLLLGCALLFKKKAGIVLLHAGIILMMASELITAEFAEEGRMAIAEGSWSNYVEDTRSVELAVVDPRDPATDDVVVVPGRLLERGGTISHADLPFDIVADPNFYMRNSDIRELGAEDQRTATAGDGLKLRAVPRDPVSGTDSSGQVDLPSAYLTFRGKAGEPIGTYLVSTILTLEGRPQLVGDYEVWLRFKRTYKPYSIHLEDFRFDKYPGTMTPKNYSSDVVLIDPERKVERKVRIWMNNPLRYRGETFYQASFEPDETGTVLQVVENRGWMVPYVGCMIVGIGMLAQFGATLFGFLRRERP